MLAAHSAHGMSCISLFAGGGTGLQSHILGFGMGKGETWLQQTQGLAAHIAPCHNSTASEAEQVLTGMYEEVTLPSQRSF